MLSRTEKFALKRILCKIKTDQNEAGFTLFAEANRSPQTETQFF